MQVSGRAPVATVVSGLAQHPLGTDCDLGVDAIVVGDRHQVPGAEHTCPPQQVRIGGVADQHHDPALAARGDQVVLLVRLDHHDAVALRDESLRQQPALAAQPADDHVIAPEAQEELLPAIAEQPQQRADRGPGREEGDEEAGHVERPGHWPSTSPEFIGMS